MCRMIFKRILVTAVVELAMVYCQPVELQTYQDQITQHRSHAARPVSGATDPVRQANFPRSFMEKETVWRNEEDRIKRGFSGWTGRRENFQGYESFTVWRSPVAQLRRPYYIPIYGISGRVPIYFPPQPLHINPGTPVDNPMPFSGPSYLPPRNSTEKPTNAFTIKIKTRVDVDDDDVRPVWDDGGLSATTENPNVIPTRPPRPPSMPEFPPLVHDVNNDATNLLSAEEDILIPPEKTVQSMVPPQQIPSGPSNCVWAIVSCCSAASDKVPDTCFEQRGCPGPFWGPGPCNSDFARAAINSALNYYNQ